MPGAVRVAVVAMGAVLGVPRVSVLARIVAIESAVPVTFDVRIFLVGIFPGKDRGGQHLVDATQIGRASCRERV